MWKVTWFYEKVHNIANFGGYATILYLWADIYAYIYQILQLIKILIT